MGIKIKGLEMGHSSMDKGFLTWEHRPSVTGRIGFRLSFCNTSSKTVKCTIFKLVAYNCVGDAIPSLTTKTEVGLAKYTGFVKPNEWKKYLYWNDIWSDRKIESIQLKEVILQFEDGTEEIIPVDQIEIVNGSGGCYVATCVYGSYDCPEVWTLRRYRDYTLAETWYGRAFIHIYYAVSPTIVKLFGNTTWFKKMWKSKLDRMVNTLQANGVKSSPYKDKEW